MTGYPPGDTFSSLIEEVITYLTGFGVSNDQLATLAVDIAPGTTQFRVSGQVSRGLIEINQELMWVETLEGDLVTLAPWGRGHKGTSASAHSAGAMVSVRPTYPRSIVAREVNNTIRSLYPTLFAVDTMTAQSSSGWTIEIPADCERILSVELTTVSQDPPEILNTWELTHSASTSSGKALLLGTAYMGSFRVTYAKMPAALILDEDPFSLTGLPVTSRDVVVLGAASRLVPWLDSGRVPTQTVNADLLDAKNGLGTAISVGRELRTQFRTRLAEEQSALLSRYPMRAHKIR